MKNKIMVFSFIAIIFGMFLLTILTNNTKDLVYESVNEVRNGEYSTIQEKITALPKSFEDTYNNHIPLKSKLGNPTNLLDFFVFDRVDSNATLLGKDRWLFYKAKYDGSPLEDYQGTNLFSEEQMEKVKKNYEEAEEYYKKKGVEFHFMICPNKEQVYSDYMPSNISVATNEKKSDRLVNYLTSNGKEVIYPKDELIESSKSAQVYYKNDTHWNKLGSFIGAQQINEAILGKRETFDSSKVFEEGTAKSCDLLNVIGLSKYNKDTEYNYHSDVTGVEKNYTKVNDQLNNYTSNAPCHKKVLIMGDSFIWSLENWLPYYYDDVSFIHRDSVTSEMIQDINPDVIVFEVVERHLDELLKPIYREY